MTHTELAARIEWLRANYPREYAQAVKRLRYMEIGDDSWMLAMDAIMEDLIAENGRNK